MNGTINLTDFQLPGLVQNMKVSRDVYELENQILVIVAETVSAFDIAMPKMIPKGQILNQYLLICLILLKILFEIG